MVELKSNPKELIVLTEEQKELAFSAVVKGAGQEEVAKLLEVSRASLWRIFDRDPDFHKNMKRAREIWTHSLVEGLIGITKNAHTMAEVNAAKVESENIKWVSGKYIPEIYGERIELNMNHHLDLSSVLLAAENRVLPLLQAKSALLPVPVDVESRLISPLGASLSEESSEFVESGDSVPDELMDLI